MTTIFENFSGLNKIDKNCGWFFISALSELKKKMGYTIKDGNYFNNPIEEQINSKTSLEIEFKVNGIDFPFVEIVQQMYEQMKTMRHKDLAEAVENKIEAIFGYKFHDVIQDVKEKYIEKIKDYFDQVENNEDE
jgi:hypothetical protein